jgi:cardiolipin synthase A/B
MNITDSCLDWNEIVLKLEGEIAEHFKESFFKSWESTGKLTRKRVKRVLHKGFEIIHEIPSDRIKSTESGYVRVIRRARKEILIVTPYFIPSSKIRKALNAAMKRGVKVKVILPLISDIRAIDILRTHLLGPLSKKGIQFFYYVGNVQNRAQKREVVPEHPKNERQHRFFDKPEILHSKLLVVDDKFFILGSSNLDYRSFMHNFEVNLLGKNQGIIRELRRYFKETLAKCRPFDYEKWKRRSSLNKLMEIFLLLIRTYL